MAIENGVWIMRGLDWDDPCRIQSWEELVDYINEVGFLPLFKNEVDGFSAEENVSDLFWWTGDPEQDPWVWRELIAHSGAVAYGKFFGSKAGFISREWFPHFANWRRDGYDFDSRWDEQLASMKSKRLMDCFSLQDEWFSFALKQAAGFGKGGEKNFDGTVTDLQMQSYLITRDFRRRINKRGFEYGWPISVYSTPEALWGYDHIASAYTTGPEASRAKLFAQIRSCFPDASDEALKRVFA